MIKHHFHFCCLLLSVLLAGCQTHSASNTTRPAPPSPEQKVEVDLSAFVAERHRGNIHSLVFSPDQKIMVTAGSGDGCKVWDVESGRQIRRFGKGTYARVDISPDGRFVAMAQDKRHIVLWRVADGQPVRRFENASEEYFHLVRFSPDGKRLYAVHDKTVLSCRDLETGQLVRQYQLPHLIRTFDLSADGRRIAASFGLCEDLRLWVADPETGKVLHAFTDHPDIQIESLAFSPDRKRLAVGYTGVARVYDLDGSGNYKDLIIDQTGKKGDVQKLFFTAGGTELLVFSYSIDRYDSKVTKWKLPSGRQVESFGIDNSHSGRLLKECFLTPNRRAILTSCWANMVDWWEVAGARRLRTFSGNHSNMGDIALVSGGRYLVTAGDALRMWATGSGRLLRSTPAWPGEYEKIALARNGSLAVTASKGGKLAAWDYIKGKPLRTFKSKNKGRVYSMHILPGEKQLLVGQCRRFTLWDMATGRPLWSKKIRENFILKSALSHDGRWFAVAGSNTVDEAALELYAVADGRRAVSFDTSFTCQAESVAFSPDDRYVLAGSFWNRESIDCFEMATHRRVFTLKGRHTGEGILALAFAPDGRSFLSGGTKGRLLLWRFPEGTLIRAFDNPSEGAINRIAFAPDGRQVITRDNLGLLSTWDVASGRRVARFFSSADGEWIVFTDDGYYDCSIEGNGLIYWTASAGFENYDFNQFESRFKKPGIIRARLAGDLGAGKPAPRLNRPPAVTLAGGRSLVRTDRAAWPLAIEAACDSRVRSVRGFVNGKPVFQKPVDARQVKLSQQIPLLGGANRITVVAYDENGYSSQPRYIDVINTAKGRKKPELYVLGVGVSDYPRMSAEWQLAYAHTDAAALAAAFRRQEGDMFAAVHTRVLANEQATLENITAALDRLGALAPDDLAVIFFAGHGVRSGDGTFYFLTSRGTPGAPQADGLNWQILEKHLSSCRARTIVLLDACHSGSIVTETVVPNEALARAFFAGDKGGTIVFSASKGRQSSLESEDVGGGFGLFTHALVRTLGPEAGTADTNRNGYVEFNELVRNVSRLVHSQTDGLQTPWLPRHELFGDLAVARVGS